jgi:hypothetical protein
MADEIEQPAEPGSTELAPPEGGGPSTPLPTGAAPMNWPRTTLWVGLALIFAVSTIVVFKTCINAPANLAEKTGQAIGKAGNTLATIAAAFNRGTITTSFVSYATTVSNHQHLQFATLKQHEIFTHKEEKSTAFGYVPLPDVVVEARAPVEYTYYVDLKAQWELKLRDGTIDVFAPPIRANKPAVDASAINYEVRKGYLKSDEAQENLKRSITALVTLRAKDNIPLVRETGRREIAEFVENWLARSFTDGKTYHVKVYFPGERSPDTAVISKPTD